MAAPDAVIRLVEKFDEQKEAYRSAHYNEAQIRQEFLNPLFAALGWDVDNRQGYSETHKEVIHEDAIRVGGRTKAPDYCFRAGGGVRTFFVEAKKPSVDVGDEPAAAYQLRRYTWSAKLPLGILTDFEEMALYDGRIRPDKNDKAATARLKLFQYTEYIERWDELAGLLSPEAIRRGAIEKFLSTKRVKKGTAEVDAAFLDEIETWRDALARNLALRNECISPRDLNFTVQRTIDRIVFLRICEDRGIEAYGQLQALLNGTKVYGRLGELFHRADDRYNSGLFYFTAEKGRRDPPDELTLGLAIDDKTLKDILRGLYYPESPYEFSVLPAEILGQVYEQFLGKVIRLTRGGHARVEEKPEVKKAGGVYYTPAYVVEYIVRHTVGKLVEGKTPKQVEQLRVVDPACGSGSFLIGAYQFLLDWHRDWYETDGPERHAKGRDPRVFRDAHGRWRLTASERKRILLANIFGVDIDSQAVEVTKLSLLLKVLEGESKESIEGQIRFAHERALPDLAGNVKCGNSLIGPDFYADRQQNLFNEDELHRINAFDWKAEFPEVFRRKNPGFDAVIGNPPYGAHFDAAVAEHLGETIPLSRAVLDSYVCFIERSHRFLLRQSGMFGFIIPSAWLGGPSYVPVRQFLLGQTIETLILLPFDVFRDAYIDTAILTTMRAEPDRDHHALVYEYPKRGVIDEIHHEDLRMSRVRQRKWSEAEDQKWIVDSGILKVLSGIRKRVRQVVGDAVEMRRGVLFDKDLLTRRRSNAASHPYFEGDVYRYRINLVADHWVEFGPKMREYPKDFRWFEGERILLRRLVNRQQRLMASLTRERIITNKNLYVIRSTGAISNFFILAILNSRLVARLYLSQVSQARKDDFPQVSIRDTLALPFPAIDLSHKSDRARHDRMVQLVEAMLALHEKAARAKTGHEQTVLARQIEATDRRIDQLVYELYGLTDKEIALVEEATQ